MSRSRIVAPETTRLPLTDDDWIEVKATLSYGDAVKSRAMLVKDVRPDGHVTPNFELVEVAQVLAYLVDWSFVDGQGKKIPIDTPEQKRSALFALDEPTVKELTAAIGVHATRVEAEQAARKNGQSGEIPSSMISPSVG
jgi:hypothetical protein